MVTAVSRTGSSICAAPYGIIRSGYQCFDFLRIRSAAAFHIFLSTVIHFFSSQTAKITAMIRSIMVWPTVSLAVLIRVPFLSWFLSKFSAAADSNTFIRLLAFASGAETTIRLPFTVPSGTHAAWMSVSPIRRLCSATPMTSRAVPSRLTVFPIGSPSPKNRNAVSRSSTITFAFCRESGAVTGRPAAICIG